MLSRKIFLCRLAPPLPNPLPPDDREGNGREGSADDARDVEGEIGEATDLFLGRTFCWYRSVGGWVIRKLGRLWALGEGRRGTWRKRVNPFLLHFLDPSEKRILETR
jgi:hypothetical protein